VACMGDELVSLKHITCEGADWINVAHDKN
jgi:hypothetical protein